MSCYNLTYLLQPDKFNEKKNHTWQKITHCSLPISSRKIDWPTRSPITVANWLKLHLKASGIDTIKFKRSFDTVSGTHCGRRKRSFSYGSNAPCQLKYVE